MADRVNDQSELLWDQPFEDSDSIPGPLSTVDEALRGPSRLYAIGNENTPPVLPRLHHTDEPCLQAAIGKITSFPMPTTEEELRHLRYQFSELQQVVSHLLPCFHEQAKDSPDDTKELIPDQCPVDQGCDRSVDIRTPGHIPDEEEQVGVASEEERGGAESAANPTIPAIGWEPLAIGVLVKNPDWSGQQIADQVGVHRTTLYRSTAFKTIRYLIRKFGLGELRANLPRGFKKVDRSDKRSSSQIEAYRNEDDEE